MTRRERLIVDTNVVVSALLSPQSVPRQAFDAACAHGQLVGSEQTLAELVRTLHKPALRPYITPPEREAFLQRFARELELLTSTESVRLCRDPRDDMFLELVTAADVGWLITGDRDLLAVGKFRQARILTPAAFLQAIENEEL